ncbi:MAG: glycosyltransferase family 9 protein [Candidatus Omnitrophica bacterium]|jgi:heptosyltransferase-2|nr:glycosyltransferase family 9 protein [Candidatus Omnitrophota bacterium]
MSKKRVLIIKLGYTETLDNSLSLTTSLGDVLRTTFILHFFKDSHVTWLVDSKARPLLDDNKYIARVIEYNPESINFLKKINFDIVINFEKLPEIFSLLGYLNSKEYFGFGLNEFSSNGKNHHKEIKRLVSLSQDTNQRRKNKDYWQTILAEALGRTWQGEEYILGYRPKTSQTFDVGFNWAASNKWTNKIWPKSYWQKLDSLLKDRFSISWQKGLDSLYDYIDWINSCRLIVTSDSLGLHLSLALKKKIVALFGPTSHKEIYFYGCGTFVLPDSPYNCIPCLRSICNKERQCLEYIYPEKVKEKIEDEFRKNTTSSKL